MSNPATWVTTALTYMQGPMMEPWKEEQMIKLEARIAGGTADTEEIHWTKFEQAFKDSFTNTNRKQEAFNQLIKLRHGPNGLDVFIAEFKRLATAAGVQLDDHGTIYHFKQGLKSGLMQAIIASNTYIPSNPWTTFAEWEKNACDCHMKWLHGQEFKKQNDQRCQGLYQALGIKQKGRGYPNQGHCTTSQGGNAMDIDAMHEPELSNKQKAELMATRACFYCFKIGHQAKDCCKKQADRTKGSGRPASNSPRIDKGQGTPDMTPDAIAQFLKDNVNTIDDKTKLSIVEKILPTGFPTGSN